MERPSWPGQVTSVKPTAADRSPDVRAGKQDYRKQYTERATQTIRQPTTRVSDEEDPAIPPHRKVAHANISVSVSCVIVSGRFTTDKTVLLDQL
jgi:hypothetical protein